MGQIGDERAVNILIKALKDEDIYVKMAAIEALGKIGDPKAIIPLLELKDSDYEVNKKIMDAVSKLRKNKKL